MQLHEQTQRLILLLIFYLLGPILTFGIIGAIAVRHLPWQANNWERKLTQQTGLNWSIRSVEFRSPGFVRLHHVQILDELGQRSVFTAPQIDIRSVSDIPLERIFADIQTDSRVRKSTGLTNLVETYVPALRHRDWFWQITVPSATLNVGECSEHSAHLVQNMLQRVFARFNDLSEVPVQLVLEQIAVHSEHSLARGENRPDMFQSVQGNFYRTHSELRSDWSFRIQGISDFDWEQRERLSFSLCQRDIFEITFQTGTRPIPSDLAAVFYSPFRPFSGGTLQGRFTLSTRSNRAETRTIRLEDVIFRDLPLAPLVGPYTTFAVAGTVYELRFDDAVFGAENVRAKGCLQVTNGAVQTALFHRCVNNFQLGVHTRGRFGEQTDLCILDFQMPMIPFTACVIHFELHSRGIDFWADLKWMDSIMYYQGSDRFLPYFIALPAHRRTVTYHEVMSLFAPDNAPVVPLTHGLRSLVPMIPVQ